MLMQVNVKGKEKGVASERTKREKGGGEVAGGREWRQRDSNPNQITCKARALPIKLCPQRKKEVIGRRS